MTTFEAIHDVAMYRIDEAGLGESNPISLNELPVTEYAAMTDESVVEYISIGDKDAPNVVLSSTPMFTDITDHMKIRWMAQQAALGEDYRLLGVNGFDPRSMAKDRLAKSQLANGDFSSLSTRMLTAGEQAGIERASTVYLAGYSLGADIATQVAHDHVHDESRGIWNVEGLLVAEAARTARRGKLALLKAFGESGGDLFKNVTESKSTVLNAAWGIDNAQSTKKAFDAAVNKGVIEYVRRSPRANLAILGGFATDMTRVQLCDLVENDDMSIVVMRHTDSTVTNPELISDINESTGCASRLHSYELAGDHSSDDNITLSAARLLHFTQAIKNS